MLLAELQEGKCQPFRVFIIKVLTIGIWEIVYFDQIKKPPIKWKYLQVPFFSDIIVGYPWTESLVDIVDISESLWFEWRVHNHNHSILLAVFIDYPFVRVVRVPPEDNLCFLVMRFLVDWEGSSFLLEGIVLLWALDVYSLIVFIVLLVYRNSDFIEGKVLGLSC